MNIRIKLDHNSRDPLVSCLRGSPDTWVLASLAFTVWRSLGELVPTYKTPGKHRRYRKSDLDAFLNQYKGKK